MRRMLAGIATAPLLCCLVAVASAQSISFAPIDVPAELGFETNPADVNDSGLIVGDYFTTDARPCRVGFLLNKGVFETYTYPDAACSLSSDLNTAIAGVNAAGDIVGIYQSVTRTNAYGDPMLLGFVRSGGAMVDVEFPGSDETQAIGIDERGRIVGWYTLPDDPQRLEHGFLLDEGVYHTVDAPGAARTWLYRINSRDELVGSYMDASYIERGFVYKRGSFTALDYPGATATIPWGIASNGRIAGYAYSEGCENYACAFVWERGAFQLLAYPDSTATYPVAINARGVIVGAYIDAYGAWRGFMAKPTLGVGARAK